MKTEPTQQEINSIQKFFNQGKLDDAILSAERLIAKYPESYVVWNLLAVCASRAKDRTKVAKSLEKAIQINPNYPEAHYNLGALAMTEGDLKAALFSFFAITFLRHFCPAIEFLPCYRVGHEAKTSHGSLSTISG